MRTFRAMEYEKVRYKCSETKLYHFLFIYFNDCNSSLVERKTISLAQHNAFAVGLSV